MREQRRRHASVQDLLPLDDIQGDMLRLRGGAYRAVLETGSLNFALRSEREQEAIVAAYRAFLNALRYPIQVLIRVIPTDIEAYLAGLRAGGTRGRALARLALDHEAFVRRMSRERTLLERRFFIVVPAEGDGNNAEGAAAMRVMPWQRRPGGGGAHAPAAAQQLTFRCQEVSQGLASFGVASRRLAGREIAELWYAMLAPDHARLQSLPAAQGPVALITHAKPGGAS